MFKKVLIVCGDRSDVVQVADFLSGKGLAVKTTLFPEVPAVALKWRPEIVVVDMKNGSRDGVEACRAIKAHSGTHSLPLLALLQDDNSLAALESFGAGADDCIRTMLDPRVILAHMQALVRRYRRDRETRRQKLMKAGELVLDPASWTLCVHGRQLRLTPKEFEILELLIRNAGVIVRRETLMERVRNFYGESSSHSLETHISNIRNKMGNAVSCRIETVSGVGYLLRVGSVGRAGRDLAGISG